MTMRLRKLTAGLYETPDERHAVERDDEGTWGRRGEWWIRVGGFGSFSELQGPYRTLDAARRALSDVLADHALRTWARHPGGR